MVRSQNPLFPPQTYVRHAPLQRIASCVHPPRLSLFLSHSSALFCRAQFANSFAINSLRTLCTKTPGGVAPAFFLVRFSFSVLNLYRTSIGALTTSIASFTSALLPACPELRGGRNGCVLWAAAFFSPIGDTTHPLPLFCEEYQNKGLNPLGSAKNIILKKLRSRRAAIPEPAILHRTRITGHGTRSSPFMEQILHSRVFTSINAP